MTKTAAQLVAEAEARIETIDVAQALALHGSADVQFVDLREKAELRREGMVPGAINVPRGLLEFWIDPESPYFNEKLSTARKLVFFCALGWRSALATQSVKQMGFDNICHIEGGFTAWKERGGPVENPSTQEKQANDRDKSS